MRHVDVVEIVATYDDVVGFAKTYFEVFETHALLLADMAGLVATYSELFGTGALSFADMAIFVATYS